MDPMPARGERDSEIGEQLGRGGLVGGVVLVQEDDPHASPARAFRAGTP
jgi:hypothetical protein